jgi:hypothetical protein
MPNRYAQKVEELNGKFLDLQGKQPVHVSEEQMQKIEGSSMLHCRKTTPNSFVITATMAFSLTRDFRSNQTHMAKNMALWKKSTALFQAGRIVNTVWSTDTVASVSN